VESVFLQEIHQKYVCKKVAQHKKAEEIHKICKFSFLFRLALAIWKKIMYHSDYTMVVPESQG